jgi:hypothetical protein
MDRQTERPDAALLGRDVRDWVVMLSDDGLRFEQVVLVRWVAIRQST